MKYQVKQASSFNDAAERASSKEVIALGTKGWVIVTATHPLLKSVKHFTKGQAAVLGEEYATQISKQPFAVAI